MRKHRMLHFLPALSLAAVLAAGVIPAARAAAPDSTPGVLTGQNSGFYSQITDLEGTVSRYDGVPDPAALEDSPMVESIASYAVYAPDGTLVLETQLHDIQGPVNTIADGVPMPQGYYSVEFCLSETDNTYVYLTGLTSDNLDQVQQAMMDAVMEHSQFIMEDLDFIDAEKVSQPQDNDDLLCWAASTSNMLHYTGWAAAAAQEQPELSAAYHGLQTTDDVFDLFVDSFTDEASNPLYGTEWFFNAVSSVQSLEDWSQVLDYGVSGGYLPDYSAWNVLRHIPVSYDHTRINQAMDSLRSGSGLAITLGWLNADGERDGGHSITVWGYIWDEDYQRDELRYYQALIVADSDSDMLPEGDRREAPNRLRVLNMEPLTSHGYQTWTFDGYYTLNCLEEFIALAPYSPDIPREGSLGGSRDLPTRICPWTSSTRPPPPWGACCPPWPRGSWWKSPPMTPFTSSPSSPTTPRWISAPPSPMASPWMGSSSRAVPTWGCPASTPAIRMRWDSWPSPGWSPAPMSSPSPPIRTGPPPRPITPTTPTASSCG